ncbi:MAG: FG-GAP-like repeat-containing protein [Acidobacteriota bacterium]
MRVRRRVLATAVLAACVAAVVAGALVRRRQRGALPVAGSPVFEQTTRAFYHGLAALQVGLLDDARAAFLTATTLAPGEPAAWANLGLTDLRRGQFQSAAPAIARAAALAPTSSAVAVLEAELAKAEGHPAAVVARYRRALELDAASPRVQYALAAEIEAAGGPQADAEAEALLDSLLAAAPANLAVRLEVARLGAKRGDGPALQRAVSGIGAPGVGWPAAAADPYQRLQDATARADFAGAARAVAVLRNALLRVPAFRGDLAALAAPVGLVAEPFVRFLRLPSPESVPSAPDEGLTFAAQPAGPSATGAIAFSPQGADLPRIVSTDGRLVHPDRSPAAVGFPGGPAHVPPSAFGLLAVDWHRDFRLGLVLAGAGGVRLLAQGEDGTFKELPAAGRDVDAGKLDATGVWTADVDLDGDLDLVVGIASAAPVVLRNNGDGTWNTTRPFPGIVDLRAFAWGDLDGDGDPDAALVDGQGRLHVFDNQQGGQFVAVAAPGADVRMTALAVADVNGDGVLDLVTLGADGVVRRASRGPHAWEEAPLATWSGRAGAPRPGGDRIVLADLDNNGAPDIIASGGGQSRLWLGGTHGDYRALSGVPSAEVVAAVDFDGDGQLDLVGLARGRVQTYLTHGTKAYHWQVLHPRAQMTAGDQRINSFGVGGEIEIRSGLLTAKQTLTGSPVHFGLGTRTVVDVARVVWPNGVVQAEFDRRADQVIVAEQRLKGSCPWVFTDGGAGMQFVTDFLWRSPLGLRINAVDTAGVSQTEDWVKIRADQLVPHSGAYEVRVTAELWETHFVDYVALMTVDHPAAVDVFVDERFARVSPPLTVHAVTPPRPVAQAWDQTGRDVTALVAARDGRFLSTFAPGAYQGVAQEHFVEVELGHVVAPDTREWLVAYGWIYPTDSSINVAIGQGHQIPPRGLSLEAQDGSGRWTPVDPDLGFPAGKNKTILIDLARISKAGLSGVHRVRLRTNMEIYWDAIGIAADADASVVRTARLLPATAELGYRGFSETNAARRDVPETPRYDRLANVVGRWRNLVGYYTRFGDVRELLGQVDDRDVIMNAGDELRMAFTAPPPPPAGWVRDFVLIGDGWVKDGDYNTAYSKTVLPLPAHGHPQYEAAAGSLDLEDDPVYRQHPADWQAYHTRFVAPDAFLRGLR